jgi:hypothetical protein
MSGRTSPTWHALLFCMLSLTMAAAEASPSARPAWDLPANLSAGTVNDLPVPISRFDVVANVSVAANEHPPATSNGEGVPTLSAIHPAATQHLPGFITPPGEADVLMNVVTVFIGVMLLTILVFYFRLHALPEHMAHRAGVVQYQIVAVLALLSLFTHNHIYWILGLLLALVRFPDFATPLEGMANSLAKIAEGEHRGPSVQANPARPRTPLQTPSLSEIKDLTHA